MKTAAKSSQTLRIKLTKPSAGNKEKDVAMNCPQRLEISKEKPPIAPFNATWVVPLALSSSHPAQHPKRQAEGAQMRKIL